MVRTNWDNCFCSQNPLRKTRREAITNLLRIKTENFKWTESTFNRQTKYIKGRTNMTISAKAKKKIKFLLCSCCVNSPWKKAVNWAFNKGNYEINQTNSPWKIKRNHTYPFSSYAKRKKHDLCSGENNKSTRNLELLTEFQRHLTWILYTIVDN